MKKELSDFSKEEIIDPELIGGGIPDLESELSKLQAGDNDFIESDFPEMQLFPETQSEGEEED